MPDANVSVVIDDRIRYCDTPPYHPEEPFPELKKSFGDHTDPDNRVYGHVRRCLANLGLDQTRAGTASWNPLGDVIRPGARVLIKPNLVLHFNRESPDITAVVTHASVLRPLIDYALIALAGSGSVVVGDAPHGNSDFDAVVQKNGVKALVDWYQHNGHPVRLVDFRKYRYGAGAAGFTHDICREVSSDPNGYFLVNLTEKSFLNDLSHLERLYGSDCNRRFIVENHRGEHKYLVSGTVLNSDVIISVPKLKTHRKTGVTINLKNMVGINGDKNYLPHYRIGPPSKGGDEYPETRDAFQRILNAWNRWSRDRLLAPNSKALRYLFRAMNVPFRVLQRIHRLRQSAPWIHSGDWPGNDTTWRTCLDLNQIIFHADKQGNFTNQIQRRYFSLVDGIVAGEGNGPLEPDPKTIGLVACGFEPVPVDYVCAWQMGIDPDRLKLYSQCRNHPLFAFDPSSLTVACENNGTRTDFRTVNFHFMPPPAWKGSVERL